MDVETYLIQVPPYTRWLLFAFIVSLSVSLNESTEVLTQFGTVGKIELNFNTSGYVPIVTWTLPQSTTIQHNLQVDNVVKTTEDYNSTVTENGMFAALEIYNVNFLDAGTYTCRMDFSDTGRSSERSIQVSVFAFPSVSMKNGATEKETLSVTCCLYVSLEVEDSIMWTLNQSGHLLILQEEKKYSTEGVMKHMCSEITFEVHRRYHRQLLRCSLRKAMNVYSEVAMDVQYPASIRYAENGLRYLTVHQFANVCCISEGNPRPSVELQWLSTEGYWNILSNVTAYVYDREPYIYSTFKIHVAARQPLQVRCFAINKIPPAATTQVLNLVAKFPASVRMLSLSTTIPEGSDIIIECQTNGYPPPDTMLVMLSNMNGSEWTHLPIKAKMINRGTTTWKFELKSLAMNNTGEYQCVANNSEGYASSKTIEINVTTRVFLTRELLAIVILAVLAFIFLVALLRQLLENRHDRSCVFSSENKRFQKDESNSDNVNNERQPGIPLYATTTPRYDSSSCEEDEDWEN
ncbi:neural cell adhesion molecule 1-like isoform X2 [Apostichopus japonicus]|uniref:neural cell adhesion molecule 1-like isoform X2 n=1 Tax=Stichopus japonicus TaxID=307972 RepID=UPI003AB52E96